HPHDRGDRDDRSLNQPRHMLMILVREVLRDELYRPGSQSEIGKIGDGCRRKHEGPHAELIYADLIAHKPIEQDERQPYHHHLKDGHAGVREDASPVAYFWRTASRWSVALIH